MKVLSYWPNHGGRKVSNRPMFRRIFFETEIMVVRDTNLSLYWIL